MKSFFSILAILVIAGCAQPDVYRVQSPSEQIDVSVFLTVEGEPRYRVNYAGQQVLQDSQLGIEMADASFVSGLEVAEVSASQRVTDEYEMLTGKRRHIRYEANEKTFSLINADGEKMNIVFRVSDDGVAFRYVFPGESDDLKKITEEVTSFAFDEKAKAWLQPIAVAQTGYANTNPSYEEHYLMGISVGTESPTGAGWVFPALFNTGKVNTGKSGSAATSDGIWVLLTEAGMDGSYHASRLQHQSPNGEYQLGMPMAAEVFTGGGVAAEANRPFASPWRIMAIGSLETIVESTLGTDLADPAVADMPFVKPGIASWSWALLKDAATVYDVQKRFIDFAADMNWEYTLIDANWDTQIGYERIAELAEYGRSKGIGIFLWYNSGGDWNTTPQTPKNALLTHESRVKEFSRLQDMGIKGLKIDFFAGDGRSMMEYYVDIARDAADHELMINYHGSSLPRGMQRTWPNLMTMEAVKGFEMITFSQGAADKAASHAAMLPFARNAFDPMDFTPTTFREIPNIDRKTTNGFQLALPALFLSGIQHIAETPEGMATVPDYVRNYLRELPVIWDESEFVQGYPGKLAVIARRSGDSWYVSGINGENVQKTLSLDLSFIGDKKGYLISDGEEPLSFSKKALNAEKDTSIHLQGNGGFVMVFE